jgi:hypothetical protein
VSARLDAAIGTPLDVPRRRAAGRIALGAATSAVFVASVAAWITAVPAVDPHETGPIGADPSAGPAVAAVADAPRTTDGGGTSATAMRASPQRPASLRLAVSPWAEIWVDGVRQGVTPPDMSIALAPGVRQVELRNPAAAPVVRRVEVRAGQTIEIAHRFAAAR